MGSDLYNKLTKYLVQHLKLVRDVSVNVVHDLGIYAHAALL